MQQLKAQGLTEQSSPELARIAAVFRAIQQVQQQQSLQRAKMAAPSPSPAPATPTQSASPSAAPPASAAFNQDQLSALKCQILAFKLLSKNMPIPPHIQEAIFSPSSARNTLANEEPASIPAKAAEAALNQHVGVKSQAVQQAQASPKPNYNAYISPFTYLKRPITLQAHASKQQRLLIPSIMPTGIDPYTLAQERHRRVRTRIDNRIKELEELPANLSNDAPINNGDADKENGPTNMEADVVQRPTGAKLRALIELKALRLVEKQRYLREEMVRGMNKASTLATSSDRASFRRLKKQTLREARLTEKLERQQRLDRERKEKQKQIDYLTTICNHGRDLVMWHRNQQAKSQKLGRAVLKYHGDTEREEQRRVERVSKERLRALKANDEEAYLKLVDQAKDHRLTHLLRQTDTYLDSLTQAVMTQQNDALHLEAAVNAEDIPKDTFNTVEETDDGQKLDYYAVAHRISEKVTEQPAMLVGGQLKEYQIKGLQWMVSLYNNRLNGILADEMGLGKTIQTISLITFLIEKKKQNGPFIVIVPLSTLANWTLEFQKWAPAVKTVIYKGAPNERRLKQNEVRMGNFQVLLTTYEYIIKDRPILSKIKWIHMIIDEGHRMKNAGSKLTMTLTQFYSARYRLILTGTPLQNNLPELWALLNFVLPKVFNSVKSFDEWFNTPFANTGGQEKMEINEEEALLIIRRLHKVLRPFLLRRLKKDVESELPDKVETVIKCKFSALQSKLYNQMKNHGQLFVAAGEKGRTGIKGLSNTIMQLRKICNHPYVFEQVENAVNPAKVNNANLFRVSSKFELLDRILPKYFRCGHRVLMFFQMTAIMSIMEDFLHFRGYNYLRLDGSTKSEDRSSLLKVFNDPSSPYFIFLLSTRAGGLGLNLQTADTVIIFDSDWNPHQDLQAQDRAHRIGQKKEVRILRLITAKSIEETILARAQYKLEIDGKVIQAGKFDNKSTTEEREAFLRSLLETDTEEVNDVNDDEDLNDEELNQVISRSEEEIEIFRQMDVEREAKEEAEWKASGGRGPKPSRLIAESELPDLYQQDDDELAYDPTPDPFDMGRGQRSRNAVHYDDGLTEDQWLNALENDGVDMNDVIAAKQERRRRRAAGKMRKDQLADMDDDTSSVASSDPITGKRKRGGSRFDDLDESGTGASTPMLASGEATPISRQRGRVAKGKRSRGSTARARSVSTGLDEDDGGSSAKRRKTGKVDAVDSETRARMKSIFQECYKAVENSYDGDRSRALLFLQLPSKKIYPQYYIMIAKPISMAQIKKKMNGIDYSNMQEFRDDWNLMFDNARTFNEEGSFVYNDANAMQADFDATFDRLCPGGEISGGQNASKGPMKVTLNMKRDASDDDSAPPSSYQQYERDDDEEEEEEEEEESEPNLSSDEDD